MKLGDVVHRALELAGASDERVQRWLGTGCAGCKRRQEKLNALGAWAARVVAGRVDRALEYLDAVLEE